MKYDQSIIDAMIANRPPPITSASEADSIRDAVAALERAEQSPIVAAELERQRSRLRIWEIDCRYGKAPSTTRTAESAQPASDRPTAPTFRVSPAIEPTAEDRKATALAEMRQHRRELEVHHRAANDEALALLNSIPADDPAWREQPPHVLDPEDAPLTGSPATQAYMAKLIGDARARTKARQEREGA